MSASTPNVSEDPPIARRRRLTLAAMCIAQGMVLLDVTIVNTALPSIQRQLNMTPGQLEWVISAYVLALAALIPFAGALGDRYGRKRLFLAGVAVFALGSVACALSTSDVALIAARAVQGVGGAAMSGLTLAILSGAYPPEQRAGAIGLWAGISGLGFGLGPVVGGILLSFSGWSSIFWVNVPPAVATLVIAAVAVPESRNPVARRLDVPGVITIALSLLGITFGLIESSRHAWGAPLVVAPLAAGVALGAAFLVWESRTRSPMLPLSLLRTRSFASGWIVFMLSYLAFTGVMFYITLLFQDVKGWSPLHTGLSWLSMNVPFITVAVSAGRLRRRFPAAVVVSGGTLVGAAGVAILALISDTTPFAVTFVGYVLAGLGWGALIPGVVGVAMRDVPTAVSGAASGILNSARQVGTSIGLAVLGTIGVNVATGVWASRTAGVGGAAGEAQNVAGARISAVTGALGQRFRADAVASFLSGYHVALLVGVGCTLVAALIASIGLRSAPRGSPVRASPSDLVLTANTSGTTPAGASSPRPLDRVPGRYVTEA
jgi:DHA2 family methylenomycin A resistance protein-like MFS transporter